MYRQASQGTLKIRQKDGKVENVSKLAPHLGSIMHFFSFLQKADLCPWREDIRCWKMGL